MNYASGLMLEIARQDVGKREVSTNHGSWIEKLWPFTSYPEGYAARAPYCAAGMCYVLAQVIEQLKSGGLLRKTTGMGGEEAEKWRCKSAAAYGWREWAKRKEVKMIPDSGTPLTGDVIVFDFSHIGLVSGVHDGGTLTTIEYNTNAGGSREGDGCMEKRRAKSLAQCFLRIFP